MLKKKKKPIKLNLALSDMYLHSGARSLFHLSNKQLMDWHPPGNHISEQQ